MKSLSLRAAAACLVLGTLAAGTAGCGRVDRAHKPTTAAVEEDMDAHLQGRIAQHMARLKGSETVALR